MKAGTKDSNPRTQTIVDLKKFLEKRILNKEEIIMSIDANKPMVSPNKLNIISSLIHNLGLFNLINTLPETQESHKSGQLINHCITSPSLQHTITAFGFLPYDRITSTDLRPTYLDLKISLLFD